MSIDVFDAAGRLTLADAARHLGVSRRTVYNWVHQGVRGKRLECVAVGGRLYTSREALGRFTELASPPEHQAAREAQRRRASAGRALDELRAMGVPVGDV